MLKKTFFVILLLLCCCSYGQDDKVYQIDYAVTIISNSGSRTVDKYVLNVDSSTYRYEHLEGIEAPSNFIKGDFKNNNSDLNYDYHIGQINSNIDFNLLTFPYRNYNVVDSLPIIKWKITNDKKKIGNFNCIKAVGNYRGRVINAYFTATIPISIGPNNLNGLPGAIIFAQSNDYSFTFSALKVEKIKRPERFTFFENFNFGDLTSLKDWLEDYDDFRGKLSAKIKLKYQNQLDQKGEGISSIDIISDGRNLLELFYEWQLSGSEK